MIDACRLVQFITDRLGEDTKLINAASTDLGSTGEWLATRNEHGAPTVTSVCVGRTLLVASPLGTQDADFMARFDPAAARREVEYGRWLLADHAERRSLQSAHGLQWYAARFDKHPDYDPTWRPT